MDNLEKFIKDNKEKFNSETPRPELWAKLNEKRAPKKAQRKQIYMIPYRAMKIAAGIAILALATFGGYKLFTEQTTTPQLVVEESTLPTELVELDQYYEAQVNVYFTKVNQRIVDPEVLDDIKKDLDLLNEEKTALFEEYGTEIDDEEIIEALISTYRMKIQILEDILNIIIEQDDDNEQAI
jgi:hypothetical protein